MNKEAVKNYFLSYGKKYEQSNPQIQLKIAHTLRVADNALAIAKKLGLSDAEQELAYTIGMLHDIGRFEQIKRFQTFYDAKSVDHAKLGVEILKQQHIAKDLGFSKEEQDLIYCAIENHNRYHIAEGLSSREYRHCRIIRDADKCDIFQAHCFETTQAMLGCEEKELVSSRLSDAVVKQFLCKETIDSSIRQSMLDVWISHIALVFDIHYEATMQLILQQDYYEKMLTKYCFQEEETQQLYTRLCAFAKDYLVSSSFNKK